MNIKETHIVASLFLIALIPRLYMALLLPHDMVIAPDSMVFVTHASNLAGGKLTLSEGSYLLFPTILGFFFAMFGKGVLIGRLVNILLASLLTVVVYLLGKELFDKRTGIFAGFFMAMHSLSLYWSVYPLTEHAFLLPAVLGVLFFVKKPGTDRNIILSGLMLGISYLARPNGLVIFLILFVTTIYNWRRARLTGRESGIFILAFLLATLPANIVWFLNHRTVFPEFFTLIKGLGFGSISNIVNGAPTMILWSFYHARVKPSIVIFLLSVIGFIYFREPRYRILHTLIIGQLFLYPVFLISPFEPRTTYIGLTPWIAILAAGVLSKLFEKRLWKMFGLSLLVLIILITLHSRIQNDIQQTQRYREYRDLGLWIKENTAEGDIIMNCGYSYRPVFYAGQFAERNFTDCPVGNATTILGEAMSTGVSYIVLQEIRLTYTTDPESKRGLEQIYYNNISHLGLPVKLELVYRNVPSDRNIRTEEILDSLRRYEPIQTLRLMWMDLNARKHILVRVYKLEYQK